MKSDVCASCHMAPCGVNGDHASVLSGRGCGAHDALFSQTPRWTERSSSALIAPTLLSSSPSPPLRVPYSFSAYHPDPFSVGSKSICLAACLAFVLYCIETVCVTQIMRVDLCGISQLLQFLTIKWDIPAGSFHRGSFTVPRRENS